MECPINAPSWENGRNCRCVKEIEHTSNIITRNEMATRWLDKKENYTLLYSRPKNLKGQYGTGFIIACWSTQCILGFEPINERMCKLRVRGKFYNMTIIIVCAPTDDENKQNADDVERF